MARLQVFFTGLNSAAHANQTVPGGSKTSLYLSLYKLTGVLLKGHIPVQQLMQSIYKMELNQN